MDSNDRVSIFPNLSNVNRYLWYFYLFALLWHVAFINNVGQFVLTGVACIWYFAPNRSKLNSPICRAFSWALWLHVGTVAFGALLLAIIWAVQIILAYIHKKVKENQGKDSWLRWLVGCLQCCAACFERLIKYISRHAYVETVLRSIGFCPGAMKAFGVITSNILRFGTLAGITELAMLFGNIFIATVVTIIGNYLLQWKAQYSNVVFETFAPLVVSKNLK